MIMERFELATGRLREIKKEEVVFPPFQSYFQNTAELLDHIVNEYLWVEKGALKTASLEELQERNHANYQEVLTEEYEKSYANPRYCVVNLGEEFGAMLSFLYTEMHSLIPYIFEQDLEEIVIRMELFLEVYGAFVTSYEEEKKAPSYEEIRQIIYWFVCDYSEVEVEKRIKEQLNPALDFAQKIILESDLNDIRYLYYFGEYITENEIETARHMAKLSEETIHLMADTFTEGYRIGFAVEGKDISKKKVVNIIYNLGFERMIRKAIQNFDKMGMKVTFFRSSLSTFHRKGNYKTGYCGAIPNKQFEFDHKEDDAIYLDKWMVNRRLEVLKSALEEQKELADLFGGPAVVETFGEKLFTPVLKKEAFKLSKEQQKLSVEYAMAAGQIRNEYIKGDERSFTIIAFPTPEIGEQFHEIFNEIIKINTLDNQLYQRIQQTIIDTLDKGESVTIKGQGSNRTDLTVTLHKLTNPEKETGFVNCVADVNIPLGEVFTTPELKGTNGILHVNKVFLNGLEYQNLEITFQEGMISRYGCTNFVEEEENLKLIGDNILFHHESLPLGEFAIGTNTTAYVAAGKYHIEEKLPILIAEKMGPHFAIGDTCFSHAEDLAIFNPDLKEVVARDNSLSILRKTDIKRAYFNCHTDITIPYDELGELVVLTKEGSKIPIILEGRFVLPGCEELNKPFE